MSNYYFYREKVIKISSPKHIFFKKDHRSSSNIVKTLSSFPYIPVADYDLDAEVLQEVLHGQNSAVLDLRKKQFLKFDIF